MTTYCKGCRAPVRWVLTTSGKSLILDADPTPLGSVVISDTPDGPRAIVLGDIVDKPDSPLYRVHWATCPHAGDFRKD